MKAFLFGGQNNGTTIEVENYRDFIKIPKQSCANNSFQVFSEHESVVCEFEKYIKYTEVFRKNTKPYGTPVEMEDLGIFIHDSFTDEEIESLSKIILMVIRAQWKPVRPIM